MTNSLTRLRTHLSISNVDIELRRIIDFLAQSSKYISHEIKKSNRKYAGSKNVFEEKQLALDVLADDILLNSLKQEVSFGVRDFISEEQDEIHNLQTKEGKYSVSVDPLDGSSLVDVNLTIGTIIGIHEGNMLDDKTGNESLVAAIYIQYGPLTTLVYTAGKGTHEFVQDPAGNFVLSRENIMMTPKGNIYSPGGLRCDWTPNHAKFMNHFEKEGYKLRYSGGFVPDINQILIKGGGIFSYPALTKAPEGKLRLLFELQPMAFIIEQAGGKATDGIQDILDIKAINLDQRSPIYIGSIDEVRLTEDFLLPSA